MRDVAVLLAAPLLLTVALAAYVHRNRTVHERFR